MQRILRATTLVVLFALAACGGGGGGGSGSGSGNPPPTVGSVHVVNSTSNTITELYVSPSASGTWGSDQLSSTIVPGGTFTLTNIPPGTYDLKGVASDGTTFWQTNSVSISAGGTFTWTLLPPAPTVGSLYLVNSTSYTVTELYVSPSGSGTWGSDQLSSSIAPSGTFTLTNIPPGTYDFKAVASDGTTFWQTNSVSISAGGTSNWTLLPPAPTVGSLKVANSTAYTITELYVSPASSGTWGSDQLSSSIAPGGTFTLTDIPPGSYDLKAVASDGTTFWQSSSPMTITAGGTSTWTLLPPAPTVGSLYVANNHCNAINQLYVSPAASGSWGSNQLSGTIAASSNFTLNSIPAGSYDIKAVGIDGVYWTAYGISILAGGTYNWSLYMPSGTGCLRIANSSAYTVGSLYTPASPNGCTYNSWGTNQLGSLTVPSGYTFTLSNVPAGYYDVGAVQYGGSVYWSQCSTPITAGLTYTLTLY